jgi:hypothetical protein
MCTCLGFPGAPARWTPTRKDAENISGKSPGRLLGHPLFILNSCNVADFLDRSNSMVILGLCQISLAHVNAAFALGRLSITIISCGVSLGPV